ncbi:MAG: PAS domain S-box protein [Bacteroidetes bacterium]|nr:PAS domain S-box protein [Bacteroidota bacterium]HET6243166.1 PAS domain S-box protein [Bacteroidia bacterium]
MSALKKSNEEKRLIKALNQLSEFSKGNYSVREKPSGKGDEWDKLLSGINALGDELSAKVLAIGQDDRMHAILEGALQLNLGNYHHTIPLSEKNDSLDALSIALNTLSDELMNSKKVIDSFEERINGILESLLKFTLMDFSQKVEVTGKGDEFDAIAIGVNTLIEELEASFRAEREQAKELETATKILMLKNQVLKGVEELNDAIRGEKSTEALAQSIISYLASHLNAQIGAFYVIENKKHLKFIAGYAYSKKHHAQGNLIHFGEGLVGQVALEKKKLVLRNIPKDYIKVNSATGETSPNEILIIPFFFEGELIGVIELGTLGLFNEEHHEFLEIINQKIGIAINSSQDREQLKLLLEETQAQAEELQTNQEELRLTNEELQGKTSHLENSEAELKLQQEELQQTNDELKEKANLCAEDKLKENEAFLNSVLDNMWEGVIVADKDGSMIYFNTAAKKLFVKEFIDDLPGKKLKEFLIYYPDTITPIPKEQSPLFKGLKGKESINEEVFVKYNSKSKGVLVNISCMPIKGSNSEITGAVLVFKDITKYKIAEQALIESESRFRNLFEFAPNPMWVFDLDTFEFLVVNKAAVKHYGYSKEEFLAMKATDLRPEDQFEKFFDALIRMKKEDKNLCSSTGWVHKLKNGQLIDVDITSQRIEINGRKTLLTTAIDITKWKKAKEDLNKAKELAENLLKTQEIFIANFSHEIRTPMNAILGFTSLLNRSELNPEQKEQISAVQQSGETLLTLINDILDMSKIESGLITFEKTPFDIKLILQNLKTILYKNAKAKSVVFKITVQNEIPNSVIGDPVRLTQILLNLIHNALKFTEQGEVTVSVKLTEASGDDLKIQFEIKDTGVGIPADKIDLIFQRFLQANSDTTRKFGGTGLGLNIVKNLVELQNGTIQVKSTENIGSLFTVNMVFKEDKNLTYLKNEALDYSKITINKSTRILFVEDNFFNQKLAVTVLKNFGFDIVIANNGKEAVRMVKENAFDLILMDLQMPEMDGYTASKVIRNELLLDIPIIAMTAHALLGEKERCIKLGMNDYISKPFNEQDLLKKILYFQKPFGKNEVVSVKENLINLEYLKNLSTSNENFIKEMIQVFIDGAPLLMIELKDAVQKNDLTRIMVNAHTLKSNLAFLGVNNLKHILEQLEINAKGLVTGFNYSAEFLHIEPVFNAVLEEAKSKVEKL